MRSPPSLAVVVPTHNEAANLPALVARLAALDLGGREVGLVVVDDGSTDGTALVAEELGRAGGRVSVTLLSRPERSGLGSAYRAGYGEALKGSAGHFVQMDADLSHAPEAIPALLGALANGADVAVGSRWVAGGSVDERWPWGRRALSRFTNGALLPVLVGTRQADPTSGFRAFTRRALETIDVPGIRSDGFAFQVEVLCAVLERGLGVVEVPIRFEERSAGRSKLDAGVKLEAAREIVALAFRERLGRRRGSPGSDQAARGDARK
ncbi:MAG: polyprenol monophosphomannose synthase [Thermoanaerobaculia bacterium]